MSVALYHLYIPLQMVILNYIYRQGWSTKISLGEVGRIARSRKVFLVLS